MGAQLEFIAASVWQGRFAPFIARNGATTYRKFFAFNVVGGVIWVLSFLFPGDQFGKYEFVQKSFKLLFIANTAISLAPMVWEWWRHRTRNNNAFWFLFGQRTNGTRRMPAKQELPLIKSARREALTVAGLWLIATTYSIGYCCTFGYGRDAESLKFILGFPDWVFWGLIIPWGVCTIVASLFAFFFMKDEDLDGAVAATAGQDGTHEITSR